MKTLFSILVASLLIMGCNKDESTLNDYDLWGRLASRNGTWEVVSLTTKDNSDPNSVETDLPTNIEFIHFYIRTYIISNVTVNVHTANFYGDGSFTQYDCMAEKERVVFQRNQIFGGDVYTVKKNGVNNQVWTFTQGNNTATMTLKRCNCKVPEVTGIENGG